MAKEQAAKAATQVQGFDNWEKDLDGFDRYESDWVGFYDPKTGSPLIGTVIEYFEQESQFGPEQLVKVKLSKPTTVVSGKGGEAEHHIAQPGDVVAVRLSYALKILARCVENKCEIAMRPTGQRKTPKGNMTTYEIRTKGILSAPQPSHSDAF